MRHKEMQHALKPTILDHLALKVTDMDSRWPSTTGLLGLELVRTSGPDEVGGYAAVLRAGHHSLDLFSHPDFVLADQDKPVGMGHLCLRLKAASIDQVIECLTSSTGGHFWGTCGPEVQHLGVCL
ncbi:hypothetical protein NKDENANG_02932 [Candidatus Entotheonellaceae bacterium PAL068K]